MKDFGLTTTGDFFAAMAVPVVVSLAVCLGAYVLCNRLMRARQVAWEASIPSPGVTDTLDAQQVALVAQRRMAAAGSPMDRLFLGVIGIAAACGMAFLGAFMLGWTPATAQERELLSIASAHLSEQPRIAARLRAIDDSMYVSKRDVQLVVRAALATVEGTR